MSRACLKGGKAGTQLVEECLECIVRGLGLRDTLFSQCNCPVVHVTKPHLSSSLRRLISSSSSLWRQVPSDLICSKCCLTSSLHSACQDTNNTSIRAPVKWRHQSQQCISANMYSVFDGIWWTAITQSFDRINIATQSQSTFGVSYKLLKVY